ncbi:MAG: TIGR03032 family protein [Bacteroidales bacterium]|nr:TIGR03032 family protein [Bacteroidales bacterium]
MELKPSGDNMLAPFSCSYTPNIPELLMKLRCSIAISTYQAGKVIFLSPKNEESLIQLPRTFNKPMGLTFEPENGRMALACRDEVIVFANSPELATSYPGKQGIYDALYLPRVTYHTGPVDIHDLNWGEKGLYAVNTLFSCLMLIGDSHNFIPYWVPPFIKELKSEDRCHLNGMVMIDNKPKYATAFNQGNSFQSWRDHVATDGVLLDVESDEIIVSGLAMPHSPRMIAGELYLLLSATGEIIRVNTHSGTFETISRINGFVRGLACYRDFLFVGLSRIRKNSSTFAKLKIADKSQNAGIAVIHLPTASFVGEIRYHTSVDEIYDVQILPETVRPNIFNTRQPEHKNGLSIPGTTFWAVHDPESGEQDQPSW